MKLLESEGVRENEKIGTTRMVHLFSCRKVKAFGRTNFISSTGCPSEHPEQRVFFGGGEMLLTEYLLHQAPVENTGRNVDT